jgi:hypothetical protein
MNAYLLGAGVSSLATALAHLFAGGYYIVRPLLKSKLNQVVKYTLYYCWHMVTILLLSLSALFLLGALSSRYQTLVIYGVSLSGLFSILSLGIVFFFRQKPLHMPQWLFFLISSILGFAGLVL